MPPIQNSMTVRCPISMKSCHVIIKLGTINKLAHQYLLQIIIRVFDLAILIPISLQCVELFIMQMKMSGNIAGYRLLGFMPIMYVTYIINLSTKGY